MSHHRRPLLLLVLAALAGAAAAGAAGPALVLDGRAETVRHVPVIVPLELQHNGFTVTAVAFSLDLDVGRLDLDPTDADMDGVPDSIALFGDEPEVVVVDWDAADVDGELDVLLANLSGLPLPDGLIMEFELVPSGGGVVASWIRFSSDPPPSFSDDQGVDLDGTAVVLGSLLFADGFESGDVAAWSSSRP